MQKREMLAWGLLALTLLTVCGGLGLLMALPSPEPESTVEYVDRVVTEVVTETVEVEVYVEKEPEDLGPYSLMKAKYHNPAFVLLGMGLWNLDVRYVEDVRVVDIGAGMLLDVEIDAAYYPDRLSETLDLATDFFVSGGDPGLEVSMRQWIITAVTEATAFEEYMGITPVIVGESVSTPPEPTAVPVAPTAVPQPVCDCSYNRYNCDAFATHREAQACYEYCLAQGVGDVHWLDGDSDGIACETLPR